jgi:hypothetical protein
MSESTNLNEARAHGNPHLDVTSLIRQESTAIMGQQMNTYDSEDQAHTENDETPPKHRYQEMFELLPEIWDQNQSFHIIDADDPELLEHGEAYIHTRLTSYIAEPFLENSDLPYPPTSVTTSTAPPSTPSPPHGIQDHQPSFSSRSVSAWVFLTSGGAHRSTDRRSDVLL